MKGKINLISLILFIIGAVAVFITQLPAAKARYDSEHINYEYDFDGQIPMVSVQGKGVPLGINLPAVENDWGSEETPIFLYTNPNLWEKVYKLEGDDDHYIVKVSHFYLLVSIAGKVGPVWSFARYDNFGSIYGVTNHNIFLFEHSGKILAVPQGHIYEAKAYDYSGLSEEETLSKKRAYPTPSKVNFCETLCIDSLDSPQTILEYSDILNLVVVSNIAYKEHSTDMVYITDGGLYSVDGKQGERVFKIQEARNGYEAIFVGALDQKGVLLRIPIEGDPQGVDKYGLYSLHQNGELYIHPYYPVLIDGEFHYSSWNSEFFEQIKDYFPADENAAENDEEIL